MPADPSPTTHAGGRLPSYWILLCGTLGLLALFWIAPTVATAVSNIDLDEVARSMEVRHPALGSTRSGVATTSSPTERRPALVTRGAR